MKNTKKNQSQRKRKDVFNLTFFIFILLFLNLIILSFIGYKITIEETKCVFNPLSYGYRNLKEINEFNLTCSCIALTNRQAPTLYFNETSAWFVSHSSTSKTFGVFTEDFILRNMSINLSG